MARPGDIGVDVMHINLHKTFSTPHGGGGPGAGPVGVAEGARAVPARAARSCSDGDGASPRLRPPAIRSAGCAAFYGNFGDARPRLRLHPLARRATGSAAMRRERGAQRQLHPRAARGRLPACRTTASHARGRLRRTRSRTSTACTTLDIAKRLIDYGFHPPTIYFPLIVHGALMIEPTESEGLERARRFVDAMRAIAEEAQETPELVKRRRSTTRPGGSTRRPRRASRCCAGRPSNRDDERRHGARPAAPRFTPRSEHCPGATRPLDRPRTSGRLAYRSHPRF